MSVRQLRWLLLVAVGSCTGLTSGNTPVAIEFVSPVPDSVALDSTVILRVLVRDRSGAVVSAPISVMALEPQFLRVDTAGAHDSTVWFKLTGDSLDSGRVTTTHIVASAGTLQSIPLIVVVDSA